MLAKNEGNLFLEGYTEDFLIMVKRLWIFENPHLKIYSIIRFDINRN